MHEFEEVEIQPVRREHAPGEEYDAEDIDSLQKITRTITQEWFSNMTQEAKKKKRLQRRT